MFYIILLKLYQRREDVKLPEPIEIDDEDE
jgi:hypothetical protein